MSVPRLILLMSAPFAATATAADFEEPWMAREGEVAVIATTLDTIRGFHRVALELRVVDRDAPVRVRPFLSEKDQRWYARRGEYELYRRDLQRARARVEEELLAAGWQRLTRCDLRAAKPAPESGERGRAAPPDGSLDLAGLPLRATVVNASSESRVELVDPATQRRSVAVTAHAEEIDVGYGRRVRYDFYRVSAVALTADRAWTAVTVDTIVPLHADLAPRRRVFLVRTRDLLRDLGVPLSRLRGGRAG